MDRDQLRALIADGFRFRGERDLDRAEAEAESRLQQYDRERVSEMDSLDRRDRLTPLRNHS